jgi:hypothetical protein
MDDAPSCSHGAMSPCCMDQDAPSCSHGAVSPCCMDQDAPTERGGYRADVCEMAFKQALQRT